MAKIIDIGQFSAKSVTFRTLAGQNVFWTGGVAKICSERPENFFLKDLI